MVFEKMEWRWVLRFVSVGETVIVSVLAGCAGEAFVQGASGDRIPPRIEQVTVVPDELIAMGWQVRVEATVTDAESGVKQVDAMVTYPDGRQETVRLEAQGGAFVGTFVAQWDMAGVPTEAERWVVEIAVRAVDQSGNKAQSGLTTVRVAIPPPPVPPNF